MRVLFSRHVQSICCFCCLPAVLLLLISYIVFTVFSNPSMEIWASHLPFFFILLLNCNLTLFLFLSSYHFYSLYSHVISSQIIDTVSKRNNNLSFLCYCILITSWLLPHYMADFQCKLTLWVRSVIMYSNLHLYWHVHFYLWILIKRLHVFVKPFWPYPTPPKTVRICLHNRQSLKQNRYVTIYMLLFTPVGMTVYY